ncbi:MAG: DUF29 family protein, partial [Planctomycetes bacterium]|nr:DUF29 family protein [Planctomycetota bacterium]
VEEMEEMSREDKINKIDSFLIILLLHLIKQAVEHRTTRSWDLSIYNAVREINKTNKRRKSGGFYLDEPDLAEAIDDAFIPALKHAAAETLDGRLSDEEVLVKLEAPEVKNNALRMIQKGV